MIVFGVDGGADHKAHTKSEMGTGWCVVETDDSNPSAPPKLVAYGQVVGGPVPWLNATADDLVVRTWLYKSDWLVVENYIALNARANPGPLEIVGMMRMYASLCDKKISVRNPAQRNLVDHDDLRAAEMWPGGKGHADTAQAIRHVISWLLSQYHPGTIALFAPDPG